MILCVVFASCADRGGRAGGQAGYPVKTIQPGAWLKVTKPHGKIEQEIFDGDILYQRGRYALRFGTYRRGFVYIYQIDDHGAVGQLFPKRQFSKYGNPLEGNQRHRIPGKNGWLEVKGIGGKERVILLAYPKPLARPEKICRRIAAESLGSHSIPYDRVAGISKQRPSWKALGIDRNLLSVAKRVFILKKEW